MSHGKEFTLYTHLFAPNGVKVAFLLEELGLTYESVYLDFGKQEQKAPPHVTHNPNGRIPTIIDHQNGDYAVWESDAILLYLVDKYDKENKFTIIDEKEKHTLIQWLFFQASGQGPYYGQAVWFSRVHHEKLPSAITRYVEETKRVISVLDGVLAVSPSGYLVGGKLTIADLSFFPWNHLAVKFLLPDVDLAKEYPAFFAWHSKLGARESVKKIQGFADVRRHEVLTAMAAAEAAKTQQ